MFLRCEKGQHLTSTEQTVIDYINQNMDKVAEMTILEIADKTFVSSATISRAIRKCGISKFQNMRHQIVMKELVRENYVVNDIFEKSYRECKKTIEMMDTGTILKVVEYIRKANKIIVVAHSHTSLAAMDFGAKLQWQGFNASIQTDIKVIDRLGKLAGKDDLVILFSIANSIPELLIGATKAKKNGAKIVLCCCALETTLEQVADITINGHVEYIIDKNGFSGASLMPLQIIGRTILEYLIRES